MACPDCGKMLTYTRKDSFDRALEIIVSVNLGGQSDRKFTLETIEKMKQPKTTQHKKRISKSISMWWEERKDNRESECQERFKTIRYNSFGFLQDQGSIVTGSLTVTQLGRFSDVQVTDDLNVTDDVGIGGVLTQTVGTVLGNPDSDTHTIIGHVTSSGNISSSLTVTFGTYLGDGSQLTGYFSNYLIHTKFRYWYY